MSAPAMQVTVDPDKFVMIPNWILFHEDLSAYDRIVWGGLRLFAANATMACNPSQETLAEICGVSERTVRESIKHLEAAGALTWTMEIKGGRRENHYHLLTAVDNHRQEMPVAPDPPAGDAGVPAGDAAPGPAGAAGELETITRRAAPRCERCGRIAWAGHRCAEAAS